MSLDEKSGSPVRNVRLVSDGVVPQYWHRRFIPEMTGEPSCTRQLTITVVVAQQNILQTYCRISSLTL